MSQNEMYFLEKIHFYLYNYSVFACNLGCFAQIIPCFFCAYLCFNPLHARILVYNNSHRVPAAEDSARNPHKK